MRVKRRNVDFRDYTEESEEVPQIVIQLNF